MHDVDGGFYKEYSHKSRTTASRLNLGSGMTRGGRYSFVAMLGQVSESFRNGTFPGSGLKGCSELCSVSACGYIQHS